MTAFFNFIESISNSMYRYPIKGFVFMVTLIMLYYNTNSFILCLFIFGMWSVMSECYALSYYSKKNGTISSNRIFDIKLLSIRHLMIIIISAFLYSLLKELNITNFILLLIANLIPSIIMTYGYIWASYKQLIKE